MNYSALAYLSDENITGVAVRFHDSLSEYTFKTKEKLKIGDLVVVESPRDFRFALAKVVQLDTPLELNSGLKYKWVVQKVDLDSFEELLEKEKELIKTVSKMETQSKRQKMREVLGLSNVELPKLTDCRGDGDE